MNAELARTHPFRWLWPVACIVTLSGYFGPWVAHPVAGLAITGLDLGEYVKFLPSAMENSRTVWREGFYLPLVVVSVSCSLLTYRRVFAYPFLLKLVLVLLGFVAAFNLLPPAWTPAVLQSAEFRLQTVALVVCSALMAVSPLLALLPAPPVYTVLAVGAVVAGWLPVSGFLHVLPTINALYKQDLAPGWGFYLLIVGILLFLAGYWAGYWQERREEGTYDSSN